MGGMRKSAILITGANGEVGHGLIHRLSEESPDPIIALDLMEIEPELKRRCAASYAGSIVDKALMERIVSEYRVREIYHLAALLSTRAEFTPDTAHDVNVTGTLDLLRLARDQGSWAAESVKFLFPSSIAVFGLPDLETKRAAGNVKEWEWTAPMTMYGCNKLYCEQLGRYYANHYRQLAEEPSEYNVDFRCLRYPGLISATTLPQGGTSDYAPEMIHAAASRKPYACFVREDTIIPFMAMPDAIDAILSLARADEAKLKRRVYNVTSFSATAGEIRERVLAHFPHAEITYSPDDKRQRIVDSWPSNVDDTWARSDWGWDARHDIDATFNDYLFPAIEKKYAGS